MTKKLTALGANIFAGLFTHGVKQAGFEVLAHLEHGPYGVATAKLNNPKLEVRVGREHWKEEEFKGKVDFMFTNPPCAAWSTARSGQGGTWESQVHRLRCVHDCVEAGLVVRPRIAWCWESVTNAWRMGQQFVLQQAEKWNDAGYHTTILLQDNQFLGTPQERQRMFLIAHRYPLVWPKLLEPITVGEVFKSLPSKRDQKRLDPGLKDPVFQPLWGHLWKKADEHNGYFRRTFEHEGRFAGKSKKPLEGRIPSVMVRKLKLDQPAPVMLAASLRLHPTEMRYMNWQEWLGLVGLPPDFKTSQRSMDGATQELSRAVMPAVGKWLATAVKNAKKYRPLDPRKPECWLVDLRKPDAPLSTKLYDFEGFTIKPLVPPPLPLLGAPKVPKSRDPNAPPPAPRAPRLGSGARIRALILEGYRGGSAEEILKVIYKEFPGTKATKSDVSWNRGRLRREGLLKEEKLTKLLKEQKASKPPLVMKSTRKVIDDAFEQMKVKHGKTVAKVLGSGARIRQLLLKRVPDEKILQVIHREYPGSKATKSDVSWNRGKLRREGAVL